MVMNTYCHQLKSSQNLMKIKHIIILVSLIRLINLDRLIYQIKVLNSSNTR